MNDQTYISTFSMPKEPLTVNKQKGEHLVIMIRDMQLSPILKPFFSGKEFTSFQILEKKIQDPKKPSQQISSLIGKVFVRGQEVYSLDLTDYQPQLAMLGVPKITLEFNANPEIKVSGGLLKVTSWVTLKGGFSQQGAVLTFDDQGFQLDMSFSVSITSTPKPEDKSTASRGIVDRLGAVKGSDFKALLTPHSFTLAHHKGPSAKPFKISVADSLGYFVNEIAKHYLSSMEPLSFDIPLDGKLPALVCVKNINLSLGSEGFIRLGLVLDFDFTSTITEALKLKPPGLAEIKDENGKVLKNRI